MEIMSERDWEIDIENRVNWKCWMIYSMWNDRYTNRRQSHLQHLPEGRVGNDNDVRWPPGVGCNLWSHFWPEVSPDQLCFLDHRRKAVLWMLFSKIVPVIRTNTTSIYTFSLHFYCKFQKKIKKLFTTIFFFLFFLKYS